MGLRQTFLTVLFGLHWVGFLVLLIRDRRPALLLPLAVFTLLILTQVLWNSAVVLDLGALGHRSLPLVVRVSAAVLAVPSIGLLVRRIVLKRRAKVVLGEERTTVG
jgi:hypothetical protein